MNKVYTVDLGISYKNKYIYFIAWKHNMFKASTNTNTFVFVFVLALNMLCFQAIKYMYVCTKINAFQASHRLTLINHRWTSAGKGITAILLLILYNVKNSLDLYKMKAHAY